MIHSNLFQRVLLKPALNLKRGHGAGRLLIVSGYATASMADRHMSHLKELGLQPAIDLIVGMTTQSGIEKAHHSGLQNLAKGNEYGIEFTCRYISLGNPVHAKVYCWLDSGGGAVEAFCGSANYTLAGFGRSQKEALSFTDPTDGRIFHEQLRRDTTDCLDDEIENKVTLTETRKTPSGTSLPSVTLSLLTKQTGETHERSGLNWGQRPGRESDQAYIPIPAPHYDFFPPIGEQFTMMTDDGESFVFVRAQQKGKALHTTQNNSLMGRYIRNRIGVAPGEYVTRQHLIEYGRTDITIEKIDEETYLLDFRPNLGPGEDAEIWPEK